MENHVTGHCVLGELRHALSAVLFGNPLLLPQEQLLANHRIHECEDAGQLTRWLTNIPTALAGRQLASSPITILQVGHVV
ncbi:hypothetical protein J0X19_23045 [Hymenobacter sp. BT186]|uniref:Uncharacterized protein n=1 Tax=Hymenobacter telluris TaxID=2816474 RepID=A0A939F0F2_9BACT|nr:hypothetical protein [Hymenobacter telluris]